jgi:hypothetical protein
MEPSRKRGTEKDLRLTGEDRSPKKWVEAGMNYEFLAADRHKWKELIDSLFS